MKKNEWQRKEKALNNKIQSLEKQIQDKENTFCDAKKLEGKYIEGEENLNNINDNHQYIPNGQAEVSVVHSTRKKTKKHRK